MKIKDILTIDLTTDIKNVIDLENISESEIQSEIEDYIVTDGLAKDYTSFVSTYMSNIKETGVWISGFYGSGKSYFGKLLGYLLSNRSISGTSARYRILQRFTGVTDEALIKNNILRLDSITSRVVFLDIAKQDTSKGLAYTLFRNFLRSLELPENEHGVLLFQLMLAEKQVSIHDFIYNQTGKKWVDLKSRLMEYVKLSKALFLEKGHSEADYTNLMTTIRRDIDQFGAKRLLEELKSYQDIVRDEKIVFLFDEASEAINQRKFSLLDLEGLSEALSSLGGRVWTIAIAQEKLDDVINNSNVSKVQLMKVTDRFKTKIHLEATEVDVIIRNRLLKKTTEGLRLLSAHYNINAGKISDHASILGAGISRTDTYDNYSTYYPFYKYQFDLLQNFLFGTKGYASTKVAARGMIITTYDVLKKEVQDNELFETVTGWHITKEGQPQPPVRLVNRYDNAERSLKEANIPLSGRNLLETIHFLSESEVTPSTFTNIVRSFTRNPETYHQVQELVSRSLEILMEARIVLESNKCYRITSDIEQRLLDEMTGYTVQGYQKKKQLVNAYKNTALVKALSRMTDNGTLYDFYITTDNDDELTTAVSKHLKIKIKSLYGYSDDRSTDIESIKTQYQNNKDLFWLAPDNSKFKELDHLIDEVERIGYIEQKYKNPLSDEGRILSNFLSSRSDKLFRIKMLVEESLLHSTTVYLYNTLHLNADNWQSILPPVQKQVIQNVYSKRLSSQVSDSVAVSVIKEANNASLCKYFSAGDFLFFDANGNFIGDNLRVVEEIIYKIRNAFVDGTTLEKELEKPPTGFSFGSILTTIAALMRAGKVIAKYNGAEKYSWRDEGVITIFSNAREFRKASFKAVSKTLSATQKQRLAQTLIDLDVAGAIGKRIDYNTNDFDLVNAMRDTAKHFIDRITFLKRNEKDFYKLFPATEGYSTFLSDYAGAVSETNYLDKATTFLGNAESFTKSVEYIMKVEKFIRLNLPKVKEWMSFIQAVNDELSKATEINPKIAACTAEFETLFADDVIKNFAVLQQNAQKVKDEYHRLFDEARKVCTANYTEIHRLASALVDTIDRLPEGLNNAALEKADVLKQYAVKRMLTHIAFDFDIKDRQSRFTYSEILSFIDLFRSKKTETEIITSGLVKEKPATEGGTATDPLPRRTYKTMMPAGTTTVAAYREWLQHELHKLAGVADDDRIEIER